jgi:outer membrane protein assembly factor BamB
MQLWNYMLPVGADSDPVVTRDGHVIYGCDDAVLYALDSSGNLTWKTDPNNGPGEVDGGVAESCDGKTIYVGGANGWFAIDLATGKTLWKVAVTGGSGATQSSPSLAADGSLYGFDSGGKGYAIDPMGNVLWSAQIAQRGGAGASTAKVGGTLYSVLEDGQLYAVDAATGKWLWAKPAGVELNFAAAGPVVDGNERIYVNGNDGFLYCFATDGSMLWKLQTTGMMAVSANTATPAIGNDGTIYVPATDGNLYAFQ